jgi:hypothetical protein
MVPLAHQRPERQSVAHALLRAAPRLVSALADIDTSVDAAPKSACATGVFKGAGA